MITANIFNRLAIEPGIDFVLILPRVCVEECGWEEYYRGFDGIPYQVAEDGAGAVDKAANARRELFRLGFYRL